MEEAVPNLPKERAWRPRELDGDVRGIIACGVRDAVLTPDALILLAAATLAGRGGRLPSTVAPSVLTRMLSSIRRLRVVP